MNTSPTSTATAFAMKSLEEARRQLARGEIKYRSARRVGEEVPSTKKWDDYTVATQKKKHKALINAVDTVVDNESYKRRRDIHALYHIQEKFHSTAAKYLCNGDEEGKRYYNEKLNDFKDFLEKANLTYPLSNSASGRAVLWRSSKAKFIEYQKENDRQQWIKEFNLDPQISYIKARHAAKKAQEQLAKQAKKEAAEAERVRLGLNDNADLDLAIKLETRAKLAMKNAEKGYLYFKCWVLPDDSRWYKIGITNNPSRREAEQNVLPVAANTLHIIALESTDHARLAEAAFHDVLDHAQIKGAGNRELFTLKPREVQAVIAAMKQLDSFSSSDVD